MGYLIKSILLLPHLILGYFFYLVLAVVTLFLWVPVLITGRYPDWGYAFLGGALRWHARVLAYSFGLSDQYPSFSFAAGRAGQDTDVSYQRSLSASRFWAIPLVGFTIKCLFYNPACHPALRHRPRGRLAPACELGPCPLYRPVS